MYLHVLVQFVDETNPFETIIKTNCEVDEYDDLIFFYGLPEEEVRNGVKTGAVFEDEWQILELIAVYDFIIKERYL